MLTQQQIDHIYDSLGCPLHFLWSYIGTAHGLSHDQADPDSFEERKKDFFFIVGKLLDDGLLKLGNRKTELIMEGNIEELVEMFRKSLPASDEEIDQEVGGLWFFTDCPFVAAWVYKGAGENGEDEYDWCF
ncbi:DUF596 domain-containing protein [Xylella fastidiosa subsp. fastidiosa]|jgi:hypothetical protein|uniref:DUF596 domain-containing protein n=3 Tax=Xylella fastidiosa TaxID=2371 RepID=Q879S9_XYLFT|nr:DUF596 domain-containing protein [Xylella fastidiosa]KAF0570513.1 hypothetical protein P305_09420 [Xylella fastidiosa subsp. fastidiosa Mus-1]AAO29934.1 conserved hypothetical protein [Xylella fastidiosa Temecula1]ACB93611.1 protein of unknown function DUF596 [Xylella fastidiosa M23]KGM19544.1 hypothetical protein JT24_11800 [Xylella fastidiosa]MBE0263287.1 DUF596 domain-containing protein [Xylella fastidiosa subsp. fastidiosa]